MTKRVAIHGERGRWVAEAEGQWLGVINTRWRSGPNLYRNPMPGVNRYAKPYKQLVAALREHDLVIVQRDKPGTFARDGYVGIFRFENLQIEDDGAVSLEILSRYADPS